MRIIAGQFKGRRLASPAWPGLRPTSDTLRETLFNVLAERVPGADVLDAFAGTGALGLEALSRGAARVTFVDSDRRAAALVRENVRRCGLVPDGRGRGGMDRRCAIIRDSVRRATRTLSPHQFDLALLDPPYGEQDLDATVVAVAECVVAGGWLVVERARRQSMPDTLGTLRRRRVITSGDSALDIYERLEGGNGPALATDTRGAWNSG